ncbi:MAG: LytTR family transcriptional regulator [Bacteroidales bacterium]|nr:LytTR family transcriptional regulator [Bacteroidales bacterium]
MKNLKTIIVILLNVLFCAAVLWFFANNSFLRPYTRMPLKESVLALFLLGSLYLNYYFLYPKLFHKYPYIYWLMVVLIALIVTLIDLAVAYPQIVLYNEEVIQLVGPFNFFSVIVLFVSGRNLSFNFFPYLLRERKHYRQSMNNEVRVVYRDVRKLDVTDKDNNIRLVDIDDIFYFHQQGNFTEVHTVQNKKYTRYGSMRHLEQLFGEEDFIRLTTIVLVPFRYIESCQGDMVVMQKMPWENEPTAFKLETKTKEEIAQRILKSLQSKIIETSGENILEESAGPKAKRKPVTPPEEKINEVLSYIKKHPNCNSAGIITKTGFSQSTVERCLYELKKQGRVEYVGSKKTGGYRVVLPLSK